MNDPRPPRDRRLLPLLIDELKRRGVLRAASVYLVVAWGAMQLADFVADNFAVPDGLVAVAVGLAIVGFPVVVVLSWRYRLGLDMESEAAPANLAEVGPQLRLVVIVATVLGLGVLTVSGWLALRHNHTQVAAAPEELERIAVLYFNDLTADPAQSYLAPAITGALIDHLGAIAELSVSSRNAVALYRGNPVPPDSIGRALGVGLLVSGTVMRSGDQLRVTAELTDARVGRQLKSVTVSRAAADPFALVDAAVGEVADSLLMHLGRELQRRRWEAGTGNPAAWTLLQRATEHGDRARALLVEGDLATALSAIDAADSLLYRAERLDRNYHDAVVQRALHAYSRAFLLNMMGDRPAVQQALVEGEAHARRVLEKDPRNASAYEARGRLREFRHTFAPPADSVAASELLASAEADLRTAIGLDPGRVLSLHALSSILASRGSFGEALVYLEEAYQLDVYQQSADRIVDRLFTMTFELGRDAEAARWCAELQRRVPGSIRAASCELQLAAWSDAHPPDVARARQLTDATLAHEQSDARYARRHLHVLLAGVMARAGLTDSARILLERADARAGDRPELLQLEAGVRVQLGDYGDAIQLLREYNGRHPRGAVLANSRRFVNLPGQPFAPPELRP